MSKVLRNEHAIYWNIIIADTPLKRLIGWLGRKDVKVNDALLLKPCNSIHTFGMRIIIDVLFIDDQGNVRHIIEHMKPSQLSPCIRDVRSVIELPAGTIQKMDIQMGDHFEIQS